MVGAKRQSPAGRAKLRTPKAIAFVNMRSESRRPGALGMAVSVVDKCGLPTYSKAAAPQFDDCNSPTGTGPPGFHGVSIAPLFRLSGQLGHGYEHGTLRRVARRAGLPSPLPVAEFVSDLPSTATGLPTSATGLPSPATVCHNLTRPVRFPRGFAGLQSASPRAKLLRMLLDVSTAVRDRETKTLVLPGPRGRPSTGKNGIGPIKGLSPTATSHFLVRRSAGTAFKVGVDSGDGRPRSSSMMSCRAGERVTHPQLL